MERSLWIGVIKKDDIIKLRQITGRGLIECKRALITSDGDIDGAIEFLKNYQPHVMVYHPPIIDEDMKPDK